MVSLQKLRNKKVLVFGLGISGIATLKSLIKNKSIVSVWDDNQKKIQNKKIQYDPNFHRKQYDYIVISPGIDLLKHNHKSYFIKNKKKIITDIDIFVSSLDLKRNKIIAITGTNGKSTFAKLLYNIIKLKCKNTYLLGNYGKPVLSHRINTNQNIYVLELSSYQIEQSKYLKTHYAAILNITPDHLERHKTFSKYFSIKCKVFNSLVPNGKGFVFVSKKYEKLLNIYQVTDCREEIGYQIDGIDFGITKDTWARTYFLDCKGNLTDTNFFIEFTKNNEAGWFWKSKSDRIYHVDVKNNKAIWYSLPEMRRVVSQMNCCVGPLQSGLCKIDINDKMLKGIINRVW